MTQAQGLTRHVMIGDLPSARGRARLPGVVASEWTKIRTVRSTYWIVITLAILSIGVGTLVDSVVGNVYKIIQGSFDATQTSLYMLYFGQLMMVVLGALVITADYSTGMISTSLIAMPRRGTLFVAKAIALGVTALVVGEVLCFVLFFIGQVVLHSTGQSVTLADSGVPRAVTGGGLFLAGCALVGFALGALLRNAAAAIGVGAGVLFVLPILAQTQPHSWLVHDIKFLPSDAGDAIWAVSKQSMLFSPWPEFSIFVVYIAVLLGFGFLVFRLRDAA
jgi:ABC-2 type transport system permease protein